MARETWGSIRKLPSKNFQASYMWKGKRQNAPVTFSTKTQAREWLARQRAAIAGGEEPRARKIDSSKTMQQLFTTWMSEREADGISPGTVRTYISRWNKHLKPDLGDVEARDLTPDFLEQWDQTKGWATAHVRRNAHLVLSSFLTWCVKSGYMGRNPRPESTVLSKPPRGKTEPKVLTGEQVSQIIALMPEPLGIAVDLAAWCALRFGEIAALRRCDIDLEQGVVHVRASIKRGIGGEQTRGAVKTEAGRRSVAIPPKCLERVRMHMDTHVLPGDEALVVHMLDQPDKWLTNKSLHTFFDPACKAVGVEDVRFHDLRHTGLTMAGRAGATLAELMHRAGHSDVKAVMIYQHASMERDHMLAAKLEG